MDFGEEEEHVLAVGSEVAGRRPGGKVSAVHTKWVKITHLH